MKNRFVSFLIIFVIYVLAAILGIVLFPIIKLPNLMVRFLVIDLICTVFVYIFSMLFNNASIYDPYWSVAPMVIIPCFMIELGAYNVFIYIILVLYLVWGLRLTLNWAYTFKNLERQDWRYEMYQNKHPKLWFLINLFGIHIMPTFIVYLGMLPTMYLMDLMVNDFNKVIPSAATIFSIIIIIVAIILETMADIQMHKFRRNPENKGKINEFGLWKKARHPNYGGEILFWIGVFLYTLSMDDVGNSIMLAFCPLVMFLLFGFISIPMMEKRQKANKPGYEEYMKRTNLLFPIFTKKSK